MRRKRRKIVVTVTERWTFVFDDDGAGTAPLTAATIDSPVPAPSSLQLAADPNAPLAEGSDVVASLNPAAATDSAAADDDAV